MGGAREEPGGCQRGCAFRPLVVSEHLLRGLGMAELQPGLSTGDTSNMLLCFLNGGVLEKKIKTWFNFAE